MSGYNTARERFEEAQRSVSADRNPAIFNLLSGLLSLTHQLESDLRSIREQIRKANADWR
jgi:hypothetical protein